MTHRSPRRELAGAAPAAPATPERCPACRNECRQCGDQLAHFRQHERMCPRCGWWTHADTCLCDEPQCEATEPSPDDWPDFTARCCSPALCDPFDPHLQRDRRWCFDHCPQCQEGPAPVITTLPRPLDWWPPGYDPDTGTMLCPDGERRVLPNTYKQRRVNGRKIREHRLIMERWLAEQGRTLADTDDVHHRNHLKWDNRLCNLILQDHDEHGRTHNPPTMPTTKPCEVCTEPFTPRPDNRGKQRCCSRRCGHAAAIRTRYGKARMIVFCRTKGIPLPPAPMVVAAVDLAPSIEGQLAMFDLPPSTARGRRRR